MRSEEYFPLNEVYFSDPVTDIFSSFQHKVFFPPQKTRLNIQSPKFFRSAQILNISPMTSSDTQPRHAHLQKLMFYYGATTFTTTVDFQWHFSQFLPVQKHRA